MKLRYDPFQIFRLSKTPAGLYARQKWLGEANTPQWKVDFQETVSALWADQLPNGSWHDSMAATIKHLFGLHLTVRASTAQIDAALTWLMEKIGFQTEEIHVSADDVVSGADLAGLPFTLSRPDMVLTAAVLFLSTIFGRESDPDVLAIYHCLSSQGIKNKGQWRDDASSHNTLRAMVVHPKYAKDKATEAAVERLADLQLDNGDWGNDFPFYQTLNALAHLNFTGADIQLETAFNRLAENQNGDGTWSRSEPEWNTFLAIHALKNKGLL